VYGENRIMFNMIAPNDHNSKMNADENFDEGYSCNRKKNLFALLIIRIQFFLMCM